LHIISGLKPQAMNNHRPPSIISSSPLFVTNPKQKRRATKTLKTRKTPKSRCLARTKYRYRLKNYDADGKSGRGRGVWNEKLFKTKLCGFTLLTAQRMFASVRHGLLIPAGWEI